MAGLEMAVLGAVLEVEAESVRVALAGGGGRLVVEEADGSRREIPALQSVRVSRGGTLRAGPVTTTAAAYLAIEGGFDLAPFLGSLSTYARGGFGGFEGRILAAGDGLPIVRETVEARTEQRLEGFDLMPATIAGVMLGPQDDYFTPEAIEAFLGEPFTVTHDADRMGIRLEGPRLTHSKGYNLVSDGIAPGSIQVPGGGQPIVLLADRQTTGGYPKIATVISADLPAVGRLIPGMTIRFRAVGLVEARSELAELEARMATLAGRLIPVRPDGPDLERLFDSNLVSGVIDAHGST
jgi:biotin-dependent carboxylase-like uncharacterized protein